MSRGSLCAFCLLLIVFLCPGCCTALLWDWAGEQATAGQVVGVVLDQHGDVVVYNFPGRTMGVRIPSNWENRPVLALATTGKGDALALAEPLLPTATLSLPPASSKRPLRRIGYKETIGSQDVHFAGAERPYGVVQLMDERQQVVQELYGYDGGRRQWILLASVNLGEYRMNRARVTTGVVLTPLVLAVDVAIVAAIVCTAARGGRCSLSFSGSWGSGLCGAPTPVRFAERERYWHSLR